jgi:hypothetical protein
VHALRMLDLADGRQLRYVPYAGHQGPNTPNNVYMFQTPEDLRIMHTGDQSTAYYPIDWGWIDRVHEHHVVDVLIANCWSDDLRRVVRGVLPKLVVTGHETEMTHPPSNREAYWRSFQIFRGMPWPPSITMVWGERYDYLPEGGTE